MIGSHLEDTIAALATPPGRGALAIVRVSGSNAIPALLALCPTLEGQPPIPRQQRLLRVHDPSTGVLIDQAIVVCNPSPGSYTGEDSLEITTHGGVMAPRLLLEALHFLGIREALPGEFTRRAMLNGKLDLLQAEAILDLIEGTSPAMHRAAIHQVEGGLSNRIAALRESLLRIEALIAYDIDFPEEDEPAAPPALVRAHTDRAVEQIERLLATMPHGELLRDGALVVLAGYPNTGKSSLFNALLGIERAIVTDIAGTTRDAIEAHTTIDGYPFRLIDTAGLRTTEDRVEALGIEVAHNYIAAADLVLFCTEASRSLEAGEREFLAKLDPAKVIIVATKADLVDEDGSAEMETRTGALACIPVSTRSAVGMQELRRTLYDAAFENGRPGDSATPVVTRARHGRALARAVEELDLFRNGLAAGLPPELAATHLRAAVGALEDLIGMVSTDDVLATVFQDFCVGK